MEPQSFETNRLALSPFCDHDVDELLRVFRDADVRRYLLDDTLVDRPWVEQEVASSQQRFADGTGGLWSIRVADEPAIAGFTGFRHFFEPPELQLIYGILPSFWGQGVATEAAAAVTDFGFRRLGFARVVAAADAPNDRSIEVMKRLGMSEDRRTREDGAETVFCSIAVEDWRLPTFRR